MKELLPMAPAQVNINSCELGNRSQVSPPDLKQSFVRGSINTELGEIPRISSLLTRSDRLGSIKARWGIGRMHFTVDPGIYGLGNPNENSIVLVTANYKMSFDSLRSAMPDRNAWILVLDTNGINVWCAAGKGTFGTTNLVNSINANDLSKIVKHRKLILPQLAGPGITAHEVKKQSGFEVKYGPIKANDLPAFLDNGLKATPDMRVKTFTISERIVLIPIELVAALKYCAIIVPALLLLSGFIGPNGFLENLVHHGMPVVFAVISAVLAGTILTPMLLPWLPGRAFSTKGLALGILVTILFTAFHWENTYTFPGLLVALSWCLIMIAICMYTAMNFTGSSTYTSLSGVRREMRWAVPTEISAGILGFGIWILGLVLY